MQTNIKTIDEYLATLSDDKRAALEKLRKDIKSVVPKGEECISYGVPTIRLNGKMLVSFGAAAKHCSFYPGANPIKTFEDELKKYSTSKGTVRFPADSPLSATLVRKIVKARLDEHSKPKVKRTKKAR